MAVIAAGLPFLFAVLVTLVACSASTGALEAFERGDYAAAYAIWLPLARDGDPVAQNYLGVMHQLGLGVGRDPARAASWYLRAARAGNHDAQRNIGTLLYRGLGVAQDKVRAYGWYQYAARGGNRSADAFMLAMTDEVTPNQMAQARALIRRELQNAAADADMDTQGGGPRAEP
ncbi:MAG: tetratricopeptide repeat protein [Gammaproteobacteria bacterium]